MPQPTAVGVLGALSSGNNSVPAFVPRLGWTLVDGVRTQVLGVFIGDIGWIDITPPIGYEDIEFIISGIPHVALSLYENSGYGDEEAALLVGQFSSTVRIWAKVMSEADPAPQLVLPCDGFTVRVGPASVIGVVDNESSVAGVSSPVSLIVSNIDVDVDVEGSATVMSATPTVSGVSDNAAAVSGAPNKVSPVSGSSDTSVDITGSASPASVPVGTPASGTYYLNNAGQLVRDAPSVSYLDLPDGDIGEGKLAVRVAGGVYTAEKTINGEMLTEQISFNPGVVNDATSIQIRSGLWGSTNFTETPFTLPSGEGFKTGQTITVYINFSYDNGYDDVTEDEWTTIRIVYGTLTKVVVT